MSERRPDEGSGRASPAFAGLLVVTYVGIGMPIGALGVAWPQMRETFGQPLAALGFLLLAFTGGNLVASVVHGRVAPRIGPGPLLIAVEATAALGLALVAATPWWPGALVGMACFGVAVAGLDAELNTYVAVHHGPRLLHLMHAGFGIGATIGPLAVAAQIGAGLDWQAVFWGFAALCAAVTVAFVRRRHRWEPPPVRIVRVDGAADGPAPEPEPAAGPHLLLVLALGLTLFFVYSGVELGAGSWGFTFLTDGGMAEGRASLAVTCYWGALTVGRLALGGVGHRVAPLTVVHWSVAGCLAATLVVTLGGPVAVAGLVALGLAQAGIFPSMVALTPLRLGARRAHRVMGLQFGAANLGGAVLPALIGLVAERRGAGAIAVALVVLAALLAVVHLALIVAARRSLLVTPATAA